ncbi:MarR family winged helix-turn-helix transcriptional regulator [Aliihoeflea sp. PC F10.4]
MTTEMRDDAPGYLLDAQVGHVLRRAQQRHTTIFAEAMPDGVTPTQFATLARLDQAGPCSQNHLGRLAAIDVATIKGVIDRLRQRGLVKSRPDPDDKRRSVLELTGEGKAFLAKAYAIALQVTEKTLEPLTERERAQLLRLLVKIGS